MSIGPTGMMGGAAGSHLPQTKGTDTDRAQQEAVEQARQAQTEGTAESAAGIGETEQDEQTGERDGDGRRLWEKQGESNAKQKTGPDSSVTGPPRSCDASGQRGQNLDLSG